jgi:ankyrin repeat protein
LNNNEVTPDCKNNMAIQLASYYGHIDIINLLLKYKNVDPSSKNNISILYANDNGYKNITYLLWNDSRVKNSLKNHSLKLYKELTILNVKNKLGNF